MRKGVNRVALCLFEHNEKAYHAAVRMMDQYGKAAIVHPTGTGKSYIASEMTLGETVVRGILSAQNYAKYQLQGDNLRSTGVQDAVCQTYPDALNTDKTFTDFKIDKLRSVLRPNGKRRMRQIMRRARKRGFLVLTR